jgi:adenosylcobyric acid synthase
MPCFNASKASTPRRISASGARDYAAMKPRLMVPVLESFNRIKRSVDLVIVEGAGSPAEANLRSGDIANMGFARAANVPVVLVGDIDRGGVIAQIIGTQAVLDPLDAAMIEGFVINKFRGDPRLFDDGYALIAARTKWRGFGVLPFFPAASRLPAEDAFDLPRGGHGDGAFRIAALQFSRIANFDDLDPLAQEPGVRLTMVRAGEAIPGDTDLVILPGSKSTRGDLAFLRTQGWDIDIHAHVRRGGHVLGICGGYQMLGRVVRDPAGIEGPAGETPGLGLLEVDTVMTASKHLKLTDAMHAATATPMQGYEIHIGETTGPGCVHPFAHVGGTAEGAVSSNGRIMGSYLHGVFVGDVFRRAFLQKLEVESSTVVYAAGIEETLTSLAAHLEAHLDIDGLLDLDR